LTQGKKFIKILPQFKGELMNETRKKVMAFAGPEETENLVKVGFALGATGEWGLCRFEPFVDYERSVQLALEQQPDALLFTHDMGGGDGVWLKILLTRKGFLGAAALLLGFDDPQDTCETILRVYRNNVFSYESPWCPPRHAERLREAQIVKT
jgi:hypothetical protein